MEKEKRQRMLGIQEEISILVKDSQELVDNIEQNEKKAKKLLEELNKITNHHYT